MTDASEQSSHQLPLTSSRDRALASRYSHALAAVSKLDGLRGQAAIRAMDTHLRKIAINLLKSQLGQPLVEGGWVGVQGAIVSIARLNRRASQNSYYVHPTDWPTILEEVVADALQVASLQAFGGRYTAYQLADTVDREQVEVSMEQLLQLTYDCPLEDLPQAIQEKLNEIVANGLVE